LSLVSKVNASNNACHHWALIDVSSWPGEAAASAWTCGADEVIE
jgi:hypothetical protein